MIKRNIVKFYNNEVEISEVELNKKELDDIYGDYDGSFQMAYDDYQHTELQAIINNQKYGY